MEALTLSNIIATSFDHAGFSSGKDRVLVGVKTTTNEISLRARGSCEDDIADALD